MPRLALIAVAAALAVPVLGQESKEAPPEKKAEGRAAEPKVAPQRLKGLNQGAGMQLAPAFDGETNSHATLEKMGWVYLFDSRVRPKDHDWDPLGLWWMRDPDPARNLWTVVEEKGERVLRNTVGGGKHGTDIVSRQCFFDYDLHVEFRVPEGSNSGVYLRGRYEIQIDGTKPGKDVKVGKSNLGAVYNVREPLANASKGPGEWQCLDATIRGFRILSVRLNAELIHSNVEIPEEKRKGTGSELSYGRDGVSDDPTTPAPLFLQGDHGSIEFKNVRVRPLGASRSLPNKAATDK